jgi:hypothetical protein
MTGLVGKYLRYSYEEDDGGYWSASRFVEKLDGDLYLLRRVSVQTDKELPNFHVLSMSNLACQGPFIHEIYDDWRTLKRDTDGPDPTNKVVKLVRPDAAE